jgi:hypothetical protein
MDTILCHSVRDWIQQATQSGHFDPPSAELVTHVAGCTQCRGALLVLPAAVTSVPMNVTETTCQNCQNDLATYIDIEHAAGISAAVHAYPHVWWHLIICPECFTTYQMTRVLLDAERHGDLTPLVDVVQPGRSTLVPLPRLLKRLHIPRRFLSHTLAAQPLLGIMRGAGEEDTVLFDEAASGYTMTLSVQKQADANWNVMVSVAPPITGQVVLTFGTTMFRAPFDAHGQAVIANVPPDLLTGSDGPDMDLAIEPESAEPDTSDTL